MAKSRASAQQSLLLKQQIPPMPEGYYSSGPNPNLRRFVEEHAKPYNPHNDHYEREPFTEAIIDESDTIVYDMHPYWSKKPHGAIAQYIAHYTEVGDLVLDPFSGSGGANSVAAQLGRPSIGIDISPAAVFISKHLCTPHSVEDIEAAYDELMIDLGPVRKWLYGTRCHRCGGNAEVQYVVWSQTYRCNKCLEVVSYYECKDRRCPHCGEQVSTSQKRHGYVPVLANVTCLEGCRPARVDRAIDSMDADHRMAFQQLDVRKLAEIDEAQIPYWYPTEPFPTEWVAWRPNLAEIENVSGFFTRRNLWAVASIVDWIDKHKDVEPSSWLMLLRATIFDQPLAELGEHGRGRKRGPDGPLAG